MKSSAHEIAVTCASARDIAVHGASDCIMFDEVGVGGRFGRRETLNMYRAPGSAPS
jgi:hypothetical protein